MPVDAEDITFDYTCLIYAYVARSRKKMRKERRQRIRDQNFMKTQ